MYNDSIKTKKQHSIHTFNRLQMHLFHDKFRTKLYSVNVSLFTNEILGPNQQSNTLGVKIYTQ